MVTKSVVSEGQQITLATDLINLGARLQVLEAETTLSRERLIKLYKELKGVSRLPRMRQAVSYSACRERRLRSMPLTR